MIVIRALLFTFSLALMAMLYISLIRLITKTIITKAISKIIKPDLESSNLTYLNHELLKGSDTGDFQIVRKQSLVTYKKGAGTQTYYIYVYYLSPEGNKRITAKIDTATFIISKVTYSNEIQDLSAKPSKS